MFSTEKSLTFPKKEVLRRIKENRDKHAEDYEEAMKGFKEALQELLTEKLDMLANGDIPSLDIDLREPFHHLKEYDRMVDMLELTEETEITLTHYDFSKYVRDEWDWKEDFVNISNMYKR